MISLPAFLSGVGGQSAAHSEDVVELLDGESAALIVVDAVGDLPTRLRAAANGLDLQLIVVLRPNEGLSQGLIEHPRAISTMSGSAAVRVIAAPWGAPHLGLVILTRGPEAESNRLRLAVALGDLVGSGAPHCQVLLEADDQIGHDVQEWFLGLWSSAVPLDGDIPEPPRWPKVASSPDLDEWEEFRRRLHERVLSNAGGNAGVYPSGAEPSLQDPWSGFLEQASDDVVAGEEANDLSSALGSDGMRSVVAVAPPPSVERDLKDLYGRGRLVTVTPDKVPTYKLDVVHVLDLPSKSEWGHASASSPIRLDLLPDHARTRVERLRREAKRILRRHSFLLDENQYWMPRAAYEHFVKRLDSMPQIEHVSGLLGMEISVYVDSVMEQLLRSLSEVLRLQKIGVNVTAEVESRLKTAVVSHLESQSKVAVGVKHSRETLSFLGGEEAAYERPHRLLSEVARETRERLANPGSKARRETEGPPLPTLDVVGGDGLLHRAGSLGVQYAARRQLDRVSSIPQALGWQKRCAELISILRSAE